jgi:hypothetical protein
MDRLKSLPVWQMSVWESFGISPMCSFCVALHFAYTKCMSVYSAQMKSMLLSVITAWYYHNTAYTSTASDTCTAQQCTLMNKRPLYTICVLFIDKPCFTQSRILKLKLRLSLKGNRIGLYDCFCLFCIIGSTLWIMALTSDTFRIIVVCKVYKVNHKVK